MGCVLSAGLGQAPARQAALGAGIPTSTPSTTVNKMCGSAMRAVMLAARPNLAGSAQVIVAGGFESMTNAPYLLAQGPRRLPHGASRGARSHVLRRPAESLGRQAHGLFAEATAEKYDFSRQAQDDFAAESVRRAQSAVRKAVSPRKWRR
jgi:acetyl-CoA C-acetyltransferase